MAQRIDNFDMAKEAADWIRQPNVTQEEADILVREVQALKFIYTITDEEECAHNVTDVVLLKAETFQISLGASYLQTSQVT